MPESETLSRIESAVTAMRDELQDTLRQLREHDVILRGDGSDEKPGLVHVVSNLKKADAKRQGHIAAIFLAGGTTFAGFIAKWLWDVLPFKGSH